MKTYPSHTSLMMAERGFFWELKKKAKLHLVHSLVLSS